MADLALEVKKLIISALNLEDVTPDAIDSAAPLFNEGLGLDSIDALEIGVALKKRFNVTLNPDDKSTQQHFESINGLVALIQQHGVSDACS